MLSLQCKSLYQHVVNCYSVCVFVCVGERLTIADASCVCVRVHACISCWTCPSTGEPNPISALYLWKIQLPLPFLTRHVPAWAQHWELRSPLLKITLCCHTKRGKRLTSALYRNPFCLLLLKQSIKNPSRSFIIRHVILILQFIKMSWKCLTQLR